VIVVSGVSSVPMPRPGGALTGRTQCGIVHVFGSASPVAGIRILCVTVERDEMRRQLRWTGP